MSWLIRLGLRHGWWRGVVGGSRLWTVVGGAALLAKLAGRYAKSEPDVIFLETLEPGQVFRITHEPPR